MHISNYVCKYANHLQLTPTGRVNDGRAITHLQVIMISQTDRQQMGILGCVSRYLQSNLFVFFFFVYILNAGSCKRRHTVLTQILSDNWHANRLKLYINSLPRLRLLGALALKTCAAY